MTIDKTKGLPEDVRSDEGNHWTGASTPPVVAPPPSTLPIDGAIGDSADLIRWAGYGRSARHNPDILDSQYATCAPPWARDGHTLCRRETDAGCSGITIRGRKGPSPDSAAAGGAKVPEVVNRLVEALARCVAQRRIDEIDRDFGHRAAERVAES